MDELVSVIIPVFNVENYLRRCLDSVLAQSYTKIEVILINDGSTDNSGDICDEYKIRDSRIIVVHKENGGLSDARNFGLDISTGKFLTFLDSDDWINKNYISRLFEQIKKNDADISMCKFLRVSSDTIFTVEKEAEISLINNIDALTLLASDYYVQMVIACAKLYKKELFNGLFFLKGKLHEDEFITYKLFYAAKKIVIINEELYYYWQREGSITRRGFNIKSRLDALEALNERESFLRDIGQHKLSLKTLKVIFSVSNQIKENISQLNQNDREEFITNYRNLLSRIKNEKMDFKFKCYFYIYSLYPKMAKVIFKIKSKK